jgi:hypothetical protein
MAATTDTKVPLNIPNGRVILKIWLKVYQHFSFRGPPKYTRIGIFCFESKPSGNPALNVSTSADIRKEKLPIDKSRVRLCVKIKIATSPAQEHWHPRPSKINTYICRYWDFWYENIPSGNPVPYRKKKIFYQRERGPESRVTRLDENSPNGRLFTFGRFTITNNRISQKRWATFLLIYRLCI